MIEDVKSLLGQALQLGERTAGLRAETPLLGNLPELDSMAVVSVITALEERYGFAVEDDEISAETFATLGSLAAFVKEKAHA
jgi:acyl carrier protein